LAAAPSDIVEDLLGHVVVVGAGARMSGLKDRLAEEMRREFGTTATVRIPADPTVLVANGALRWAHFLQDEEWEIPLFSLAR
jgi:actin-related protein